MLTEQNIHRQKGTEPIIWYNQWTTNAIVNVLIKVYIKTIKIIINDNINILSTIYITGCLIFTRFLNKYIFRMFSGLLAGAAAAATLHFVVRIKCSYTKYKFERYERFYIHTITITIPYVAQRVYILLHMSAEHKHWHSESFILFTFKIEKKKK